MDYRQPQHQDWFRNTGTRTPSVPSWTSHSSAPRWTGCAAQPQLCLRCWDRPRKAEFTVKDGTGPRSLSAYWRVSFCPSPERLNASCSLCLKRSPLSAPAPPAPSCSRPSESTSHPQGRKVPWVLSQAAILSGNHIPLFTPKLGFYICLSDDVTKMCVSLDWPSLKTWLYLSHLLSSQSPAWCLTHSERSVHICYVDKQIDN